MSSTIIQEKEYELPDHIKLNVVEATRQVAFSIATEGVGEKEQAHGCLFIVGDAARLCSEKEKFGRVGLPDKNFSKPPWGQDEAYTRYNVLRFVSSNSVSQRGIQSLCKEDAGIVIDGRSGDVWCGNFTVGDLTYGTSSGGTRGKAASSIAEQAGGCFAIKLSDNYCGSVSNPPPANAKIEVYPCSSTCRKESIPINGNNGMLNQKDDELLTLRKTLVPLQDTHTIQKAMESFTPNTREWAMSRFDDWTNLENKTKHKVLVLSAVAGLGKTTIASRIIKERSDVVIAYYFCKHDDDQRHDPKRMLSSLAYQMAERLPAYKEALVSSMEMNTLSMKILANSNLISLFNTLLKEPLYSIKQEPGQYVIVIDALDECQHDGRNNILDCIQRHFRDLPTWLRFFITTRPEVPIIGKLKGFNPEVIEAESEKNLKDLRVFFQNLLAEENIETEINIDKLVEKSEGLFIYASLLADTLRDQNEKITQKMVDELPTGIYAFYEEQFSRIFDTESDEKWYKSKGWNIVGMIVVAAEPLHLKLLENFTGLSVEELKKSIKILSRFFIQDNEKRLHTYHKSLADWLTHDDNESDFYVNPKDNETIFAKKSLNILQECNIPDSTAANQIQLNKYDSVVISYILQHGIKHLCSAGMEKEARRLVLDVGWIVSAAERLENRYNLVMDCERLSENDRIMELMGRAIGLAMNAMKTDYRQLPGQLIGRLGGGGLTKNAKSNLSAYLLRLEQYKYGWDWWCPVKQCWDQASNPCVRILEGHSFPVTSIAWSPDGERLASGSLDNTIRIWDPRTGDCERTLEGHTHFVKSIAWSPDGERLASGSLDETIRIWDPRTGDCERTLEGHSSDVHSIAWSPDGERLASGSRDNTHFVKSIAWSPDGERLASASDDVTIRIWDPRTGDCERTLEGHSDNVQSIAWSPDGERLASGSRDNTIRIWDSRTGDCERTLEGHSSDVHYIAWSPDGERLASGSYDNTIRIWDPRTGDCKRRLEGHSSYVNSIAWSPDGERLASGSYDNTIRIWDPRTGDCKRRLEGHSSYVNSIAWSPDGERLASGSRDNTIRIWDPRTGDCERTLEGHSSSVNSIAWSPDGERLASGSYDNTIRIWDPRTGDCEKLLEGHSSDVHSIAWSPDGERLASGSEDNTIRIWDPRTGDCERKLDGHSDSVITIAYSPDGERLASGSYDKTIRIWDPRTGDCERTLEGHSDNVQSIAWSPDGERLASGSWDNTIRIWDPRTGDCERTLEGHSSWVISIAWSPDGERLASGSYDNTIQIWDPRTGDCEKLLEGHSDSVITIAWSPDGERLASGSDDKTIRIWNIISNICIEVLDSNFQSFPPHNVDTSIPGTGIQVLFLSPLRGNGSSLVAGMESKQGVSTKGDKGISITNPNSIGFFKLLRNN